MSTTPANSPVTTPRLSAHGDPAAHRRVGGGFSTDALAARMLQHQDTRSVQFQTDHMSFNRALDNFMGTERRTIQEEHSFLLSKGQLTSSCGLQHFENVMASSAAAAAAGRGSPALSSFSQRAASAAADTSAMLNASVTGVDRNTVSSRNKTRLGRTGGPHASASASRIHSSSMIHREAGVHGSDGSCCAWRHHTDLPRVDGLFVTFCEDTIESKYLDALRRAELEQGQRELDAKAHRAQLAELLSKIQHLEQVNADLKAKHTDLQKAFTNDTTGLSLLRDAYEGKYREQLALTQSQQATVDSAKTSVLELREKIGAQENTIMNQNKMIRELTELNVKADRSSLDSMKRQDLSLMQQGVLQTYTSAQTQEIAVLKETLRTKDLLVDGMQKELNVAYSKINSVAILRDQVKRANRRKD